MMRGGEEELRASIRAVSQLSEEEERRELAANLSSIGGLRYDRHVIDQLLGEIVMNISIHEFSDSSIYQEIAAVAQARGLEEGLEIGRAETLHEMLRHAAARRFPGLTLSPEIERSTDLTALEIFV